MSDIIRVKFVFPIALITRPAEESSDNHICEQYRKYYYYLNGNLYRRVDNKIMGYIHTTLNGYNQLSMNDRYYVGKTVTKGTNTVIVARVIYMIEIGPIPSGFEVDHIDRNSLNNLSTNLRAISRLHNLWNRNSKNKYFGAIWNKTYSIWTATVFVDGKNRYIGRFETEIEAAKAYNAYVIANNLDKRLNIFE